MLFPTCLRLLESYQSIELVIVQSCQTIDLSLYYQFIIKRLTKFLEKYHILNENQFGFRSNCSTIQAILLIADKIQRAIENKKISCGIFLDLSKAFDTVDHTILIKN